MPKILSNPQQNILKCGKDILLTEGYAELTMRKIAERCNIAVGTIYGYYKSKEYLCAAIMLEDWFKTVSYMKEQVDLSGTAIEGLETVFLLIKQYSDVYRDTWKTFSGAGAISEERHNMLIGQLVSVIDTLLIKFKINSEPGLNKFLAEIILGSSARQHVDFDEIKTFIKKLL